MTYIIVIVLVAFSALFSGLTLGLMGLDASELKRKMALGDKQAAKIYEVRENGNLLLTTLLIGNVAVNSALSIFLGSIVSGIIAGLAATSLIVVFGEIIPQAAFSRYAMQLGSKVVWLVKIFIFGFYPVSWPISKALDKIFGDEMPTVYSKRELLKIVEEHKDSRDSDVKADEERIVKGALTFSEKRVKDVMTPRPVLLALAASQPVNKELLTMLKTSEHTRYPVYRGKLDNVVGVLYLRDLVGIADKGQTVGEIARREPIFINEEKPLDEVYRAFLRSHQHLSIVQDEFGTVSGVITLEDILEEIIHAEIMDEADKSADLRKTARSRVQKASGSRSGKGDLRTPKETSGRARQAPSSRKAPSDTKAMEDKPARQARLRSSRASAGQATKGRSKRGSRGGKK